MPPLAATATPTTGINIQAYACLVAVLAVITGGYLLTCWLYPFTNCRHCHGTGKRRSILGRHTFALCRHCHGNGRQLRPGRHILNHLRALHTRGTTTKRGQHR